MACLMAESDLVERDAGVGRSTMYALRSGVVAMMLEEEYEDVPK